MFHIADISIDDNPTNPSSILGGSDSSVLDENTKDNSDNSKEKSSPGANSANTLLGNGALEQSGVGNDDANPRLEAALKLFDQGLSAFYQSSMLRTGYPRPSTRNVSRVSSVYLSRVESRVPTAATCHDTRHPGRKIGYVELCASHVEQFRYQ